MTCRDLAVHPSGRFLTGTVDREGVLLRPSDLAIVRQVPGGDIGVDPTAAFAAVDTGGSIDIVKTATRETVGRLKSVSHGQRLDLPNSDTLLVDCCTYHDVKTGIPVWRYQINGESAMLASGATLCVAVTDRQTVVAIATPPDAAALAALKNVRPDQFALAPGAHIKIEGDLTPFGDAAAAHKKIEQMLTAAGHKPDDAGPYTLTTTAAAGPIGRFSTRVHQLLGPPILQVVDAPTTLVNVVLTRDGQTIWKREMKFGARRIDAGA